MTDQCTKEKLDEFSKKHFTYINQIFGDAAVREIIEEEYPTTYEFEVEETGADFEYSYHHTVKDRDNGDVMCSVLEGKQNIYKNKNDTLCQSYSLMNYFDIEISDDKKQKQMDMVQMYRDILNGTMDGFDDVDFKGVLYNQILSNKRNKNLWRDYVYDDNGTKAISMAKSKFFHNIENTLDEWEEFGYWFFIGKGNCPITGDYSAEKVHMKAYSDELDKELNELIDMRGEDVRIKTPSKSKSKSPPTRKSKSNSKSSSNHTRKSKSSSKRSSNSTRSKRMAKSTTTRKSRSATQLQVNPNPNTV